MLEDTDAHALPLGAGACSLCATCTYPNEPCSFPERMITSMEASGLLVSDVCAANGLAYNHGKNTIAFTSCCLF
jgi:predicted metal-binding protein